MDRAMPGAARSIEGRWPCFWHGRAFLFGLCSWQLRVHRPRPRDGYGLDAEGAEGGQAHSCVATFGA
eukprot:1135481-Lingulodinium_polyedra.AAC.1